MKKAMIILTLSLFMFPFSSIYSMVFTIDKQKNITKRGEEIKSIITDYENYCESGCKYKLSSVKELKVVEKVDENHLFNWCHVENVRDSYTFSMIHIDDENTQRITIESTFPSKEKIKELKENTKLIHQTLIDDLTTTWTLEEKFDQEGKFLYTQVSYLTKMSSNSSVMRMFASTVRKSMRETAEDMFEAIGD